MAKIPGLSDTLLGNYTLGEDWIGDTNSNGQADADELIPNARGNQTLLYKMMHYAIDTVTTGSSDIILEHFAPAYFSQEPGNPQWIQRDSDYFVPIVCVYNVIYD